MIEAARVTRKVVKGGEVYTIEFDLESITDLVNAIRKETTRIAAVHKVLDLTEYGVDGVETTATLAKLEFRTPLGGS